MWPIGVVTCDEHHKQATLRKYDILLIINYIYFYKLLTLRMNWLEFLKRKTL